MFPSEKIEEWIQEVTERPSSAPLVIQFIANRLNDLSQWNEKLREENIALRTEKRVQEYEQQIKHLTYQLELLKRQFGGELPDAEARASLSMPVERMNLLLYDDQGRIGRWELDSAIFEDGRAVGNLNGLPTDGEPARLLVAPASEELLCVFTSGRIAPLPVASIPTIEAGAHPRDWAQVPIPREPALGEALASLMTVSKLALSDFILQISRRGYMKKIRMALVASIMDNLYIGTGAKLPGDQTMDVLLAHDADRYLLLSEEAVRLNSTDHLVAALTIRPEQSLVAMTQIGKAIHRTAESIEIAEALKRKGKALYSKARREKGVRVVGGGAVDRDDWGLALHQDGAITLHAMQSLLQSGTIPVAGEILAFVTFPNPEIPREGA